MKKILFNFLIVFSLWIATTTQASAQAWTSECFYDSAVGQIATIGGITCIMRNILGIIIPLIGVALLVMIVYGAYQILISGGDPKGVAGGKSTITYAVLGLVVALSSLFMIRLVGFITGVENITSFNFSIEDNLDTVPDEETPEPEQCTEDFCDCSDEACLCGNSTCYQTCDNTSQSPTCVPSAPVCNNSVCDCTISACICVTNPATLCYDYCVTDPSRQCQETPPGGVL